MGQGQGQGLQAGTSGIQGPVYAIIPPAEAADQPVIQGTFLLSRLWEKILFDSGASHSFISALVVRELGLEVETLEELLYVSSPLRARVSVDQIGQDGELGIFGDSTHCGPSGHKHVGEYVLIHWIFNDCSICM